MKANCLASLAFRRCVSMTLAMPLEVSDFAFVGRFLKQFSAPPPLADDADVAGDADDHGTDAESLTLTAVAKVLEAASHCSTCDKQVLFGGLRSWIFLQVRDMWVKLICCDASLQCRMNVL